MIRSPSEVMFHATPLPCTSLEMYSFGFSKRTKTWNYFGHWSSVSGGFHGGWIRHVEFGALASLSTLQSETFQVSLFVWLSHKICKKNNKNNFHRTYKFTNLKQKKKMPWKSKMQILDKVFLCPAQSIWYCPFRHTEAVRLWFQLILKKEKREEKYQATVVQLAFQ